MSPAPHAISDTAPGRANTRCIRAACERLGLTYQIHDTYGNFLSVELEKPYFFVNFSTPFNNGSVDRICQDKEFSWLLSHDIIRTPRTKGYFNPQPADVAYSAYIDHLDCESITREIVQNFSLPVIVKMNSGREGKNVFLCSGAEEIQSALEKIYDHNSSTYDYVAIAQEYILKEKEYRVIVFRGEVLLVYEKDCSAGTFVGNLSPLHYENAVARHIDEPQLILRMQEFIAPLIVKVDLEFAGLDVILDKENRLHLLEMNSRPGFSYFVRDNGEEKLIQMYERILKSMI
ncbi:MAG: Glutathione synthase/RimK-type ligase, ATP-grasp superfamily [Parcubacteria group bacterium]|nr:Glutathione synthase/RimK-type ligase, ATP-grasp superfamily [Parcubacteria group bacterium]